MSTIVISGVFFGWFGWFFVGLFLCVFFGFKIFVWLVGFVSVCFSLRTRTFSCFLA